MATTDDCKYKLYDGRTSLKVGPQVLDGEQVRVASVSWTLAGYNDKKRYPELATMPYEKEISIVRYRTTN